MTPFEILTDYESLLIQVEETLPVFRLMKEWLDVNVNQEDRMAVADFLDSHSAYFSILKTYLHKLEDITEEHRNIIDKDFKERQVEA